MKTRLDLKRKKKIDNGKYKMLLVSLIQLRNERVCSVLSQTSKRKEKVVGVVQLNGKSAFYSTQKRLKRSRTSTYSIQAAFSILPRHVFIKELRWRVHVMVDLHHRCFPVTFVAYHQCLIRSDNILMVFVQWVP